MQEELPATGAHGHEAVSSGSQTEFAVIKGWGRGLLKVRPSEGSVQ
ncbi:MAG: hypothetical protein JRN16_03765 [Nitrososphaerota archaeon]|nr:hypothetical protein [Nitrososphaerota archaeon]MDG7027510.1 hypothetical protein [Nitrososphaerota archaeon]